ncbi:MAG: hypothetical protein HZA63_14070 [Rhodocyclales bacterium]|nr:hypothetical protein [Rhodocyclales bacterium]
MHDIAAALLGLEVAVVGWMLLRTSASRSAKPSPPGAAIVERRHAVRAEIDALLGEEEADQLLCGMARHEGHPVFDLALLERALESAKALSGKDDAPTTQSPGRQEPAGMRRADTTPRTAFVAAATDQQIEIPLPPSLVGQRAARGARHG